MQRLALSGWPHATAALLVAAVLAVPLATTAEAQQRASYTQGQGVSPGYEGWWENEDGTFSIIFGYMNRNWEEIPHVPIGPDNFISPGPEDQGQPTRFLPRRNRFIFEVRVPADFGNQELVWTLNVNGETDRAYGSLARDYRIDNMVVMSETGALGAGSSDEEVRSNTAPVIELEGESVRSVRVGEPLTLAALVTDDGIPSRRGASTSRRELSPQQQLTRALQPPVRITVGKTVGLYFGWYVYRGPSDAEFDPPQVKTWEDTRPFANSPWAHHWEPPTLPEDDRWVTQVTFDEPGTYVLRGRADDGGLYADVELTVHVTP
jgi:hypothetical protein